MRPAIRRTLELIAKHAPGVAATEALKALRRNDDLIGLRRVAAYARYVPVPDLSDDDRDALIEAQQLAADVRGPGRPPTGQAVHVRLPEWVVTMLDGEVQAGRAPSRADLIREILTNWADAGE